MGYAYNVPRSSNWNYGGPRWKLSRAKIEAYEDCKMCFYLDNVHGGKRPPGFPFTLNSAVDTLLKNEFDHYRDLQERHPIQMTIEDRYIIPSNHPKMDTWRENFEGVEYDFEELGFIVHGAIDDLWYDKSSEEYIVVDYKSTAGEEPTTALNEGYHDSYKRQMDVYLWLLRRNGLKVSDTTYFVYATGRSNEPGFNNRIVFDTHLIPYIACDNWVEDKIREVKAFLDRPNIPIPSRYCHYCKYRNAILRIVKNNPHKD